MYGVELEPPYKIPKLLTTRCFVLEYVRYMVDIELFHFLKSKMKIHIVYLGVMMGYDFSKGKGANEAIQVLDKLSFLLKKPWNCGPHFTMRTKKGKYKLKPNVREKGLEKRIANKKYLLEVKSIL